MTDDFDDLYDPDDMRRDRCELSDYVNLKVSRGTDLVNFWLEHRAVLPKLFSVAQQMLCIPASSAVSERVFSTAGRLLQKRPTSLAPSTVNSLLFLHSNMP